MGRADDPLWDPEDHRAEPPADEALGEPARDDDRYLEEDDDRR